MKVKHLETALEDMKKQNMNVATPKNDLNKHYQTNHNVLSLNCNLCETTFSQKCDLELHLQYEHYTEKKFKCDKCEMRFVLKWILQKHVGIHEEKNISNMNIVIISTMIKNAHLKPLAACLNMKMSHSVDILVNATKLYVHLNII